MPDGGGKGDGKRGGELRRNEWKEKRGKNDEEKIREEEGNERENIREGEKEGKMKKKRRDEVEGKERARE